MKNNVVKILATLGLIVALALVLKGVFGVGKIGFNKKNVTKEKNISMGFKTIRFTCEAQLITKTPFETLPTKTVIDQYSVRFAGGKAEGIFLDETNDQVARIDISLDPNFKVSPLAININHSNYPHGDEIYVRSYKASISLQSGTYAGSIITKFRGGDVTNTLTGKCFGLDEIKRYTK